MGPPHYGPRRAPAYNTMPVAFVPPPRAGRGGGGFAAQQPGASRTGAAAAQAAYLGPPGQAPRVAPHPDFTNDNDEYDEEQEELEGDDDGQGAALDSTTEGDDQAFNDLVADFGVCADRVETLEDVVKAQFELIGAIMTDLTKAAVLLNDLTVGPKFNPASIVIWKQVQVQLGIPTPVAPAPSPNKQTLRTAVDSLVASPSHSKSPARTSDAVTTSNRSDAAEPLASAAAAAAAAALSA